MTTNLDRALGIHADALLIRSRRAELLAANIANADTPGYQARDIDFAAALKAAQAGAAPTGSVARTHAGHQGPEGREALIEHALRYRVPMQSGIDGNTVDAQQEHAAFMQNAVQYQASLHFLNGRIRSLLTAIKGE